MLLAAADTFRAAAIEQLEIWGDRTGAEVIKNKPGGDPAAVLYDAMQAAKARKMDYVIVDTAGPAAHQDQPDGRVGKNAPHRTTASARRHRMKRCW